MLLVTVLSGAGSARENRDGLAGLVGDSAITVLGRPWQESSTQMVGEVETRFHQCSPQVIAPSPATTSSCPYCGGSAGAFGMIWWAEHRLYVCGAC